MTVLIISVAPLSSDKIIAQLRELRKHSLVEYSHFAVGAVVEVKLKNDSYAYVGGVNVEDKTLNRISTHAEQNAIAAALSLFGGDTKFAKVWVMGALDHIKENSHDAAANNSIYPCGHCRQILLSLAAENAEMYSVTVNGEINAPHKLKDLLPHAFSEQDFISPELKTQDRLTQSSNNFFVRQKLQPLHLFYEPSDLSAKDIWQYFCSMSPHIIKREHQTSRVTACIIKSADQYSPGVLMQDAAFLTTEAISAALGQTISRSGARKLDLQEIHLCGNFSEQDLSLNGSEIEMISRFAKKDILIYFYAPGRGLVNQCNFSECITKHNTDLLEKLHSTNAMLLPTTMPRSRL